jgi:hypothetical protein
MTLKIRLDETQIKITSEVNQKLQNIVQNWPYEKIKIDKKNFVNVLFNDMTEEELIERYTRAIGLRSK